jgi:cell division inhibitor SepF
LGFVDSFLNIMRLNPDEDEYEDEYDDEYLDEEEEEEPVKHSFFGRRKAKQAEEDDYESEPETKRESRREKKAAAKEQERLAKEEEKTTSRNSSKVLPMRQTKRQIKEAMEVCIIKPTTVDDAREITLTLLNGRTVILNMEGLNIEIAQRIIDFASGSMYAIDGNLQKISNAIFVITPPGVDISGDIQDLIGSVNGSGMIQANL